jgi:hypothetical protein
MTSVSVVAGVASKARLPKPAQPAGLGAQLADQRKPKNNAQHGNASQREPNPQIVALRSKVDGKAIVESLKLRR